MKRPSENQDKIRYQELRNLSWNQLWNEEVPEFNQAPAAERKSNLALIRAVGVVFSESGPRSLEGEVRNWLRELLKDPEEKIRRYALNALPKIGGSPADEASLLALLETTGIEREKKHLGRALDKIGHSATLASLQKSGALAPHSEQKLKASIARTEQPSAIRLDRELSEFGDLEIHLRTREGLESILREEVTEAIRQHPKFRITGESAGCLTLIPLRAFSLDDLYSFRCFGTLGLVLGAVGANSTSEELARLIASPLSQRILRTFTDGPIRYRMEFIGRGHQRGTIREIVARAYALCPEILNDPRSAPWAVEIHPDGAGETVELRPRISPDPRFAYRVQDIPAASHPPLAAAMARLAGTFQNETVWDPFCGSGVELIECALRGGVRALYGTDRSAAAIAIAKTNLAAANVAGVSAEFACTDFRDYAQVPGLKANRVSLIISNPPMGKRVPIPDLAGLLEDLLEIAARVLQPGGRLIFPNPLPVRSVPSALKLQYRQLVDLGGFDCQLEVYQKAETQPPKKPFHSYYRKSAPRP